MRSPLPLNIPALLDPTMMMENIHHLPEKIGPISISKEEVTITIMEKILKPEAPLDEEEETSLPTEIVE